MRIGLVRHFKVDYPYSKFMTSGEFEEWVNEYDNADIENKVVDLGNIDWQICFSSDLSRAVKTAEAIYHGEIVKTEKLREVPISPIAKTYFKVPYGLWSFLGRTAWVVSHKSQMEKRYETENRTKEFITSILSTNKSNILVVSHGFLMFYLQKELFKRGFKGEKFVKAENGKIYIYEK